MDFHSTHIKTLHCDWVRYSKGHNADSLASSAGSALIGYSHSAVSKEVMCLFSKSILQCFHPKQEGFLHGNSEQPMNRHTCDDVTILSIDIISCYKNTALKPVRHGHCSTRSNSVLQSTCLTTALEVIHLFVV